MSSAQQRLGAAGLPTSMAGVAPVTIAAAEGAPIFRSALVMYPAPVSDEGAYSKISPQEVGTSSYQRGFSKEDCKRPFVSTAGSNWLVNDGKLRSVPSYYPLAKTSGCIVGAKADEIAFRISECCRIMSVQADYDHEAAAATLRTKEHVELRLSLWRGTSPRHPPNCVIVEVQRYTGDAVIYHKYCRNILNAAQGVFHAEDFVAQEERERSHAKMAERVLAEKDPWQHRAEQRRNSMRALEIVSSLLDKDRVDAQQLGMDSLCLLTDPARIGMETALMASQVVLTGSARDEVSDEDCFFSEEEQGIREAVLSLVQFGKLKEFEGTLHKEKDLDAESIDQNPEEEKHGIILHSLGLAVLANALRTLECHSEKLAAGRWESPALVVNEFLLSAKKSTGQDIFPSLLDEVRNAWWKPHDACLSVQSLRSLCEVSTYARQRACNSDAKNIILTALDIGRRMDKSLEEETERLLATLEKPFDI